MALVRDTLTWTADSTALKAYLQITAATWDTQLELWYTQAAQEADVYFEDRDWVDDVANPIKDHVGIRVGCYDWVRACFEGYKNKAAAGGVTSIKTAQLARGFAAPEGGGGLNLVDLGRRAASPSWRPYKADVLIGGLL